MSLKTKLEELEKLADAVLGDGRGPDDPGGVTFFLPDNGRGDGPPSGQYDLGGGRVVIFLPAKDDGSVPPGPRCGGRVAVYDPAGPPE